jgi:hypothetical protein
MSQFENYYPNGIEYFEDIQIKEQIQSFIDENLKDV